MLIDQFKVNMKPQDPKAVILYITIPINLYGLTDSDIGKMGKS